jgi:hypothetical protein
MKNGKIRHYSNKQAYLNSIKGMFANQYQKKNHSRKIQKAKAKNKSRKRMQHRGVKSVKTGEAFCKDCKRKTKPLSKGRCNFCKTETKKFDTAQLKNLADQMDIHAEEWQKLWMKKAKQRARLGDHLDFPEEEKLNDALQNYLEARNNIREIDPKYFLRKRNE